MKKVLLSGCSLSAASGWGAADYYEDPRCWYNILAKKHQFDLHNIAYGGHSNRGIIHRASQMTLMNSYDLVVVALTSDNRVWYWRDKDPLDFVTMVGGNIFNAKNSLEHQALKIMSAEFNNHLNEIERDLTNLILLQQHLNTKSVPMLLVNFSNFVTTISNILKDNSVVSQDELLLNTNHTRINLSVYYKRMSKLASMLELTHSVGVDKGLLTHAIDLADDNMHPGEKSNQIFADIISNAINKIYE